MDRRVPLAIGLDAFSISLFVALGRRSHDRDGGVSSYLETLAPFLVGLAVAWLLWRAWRRPTLVRRGLEIWPVTVLVGMVARRAVFDDGTATSFVVVATLFIGAFLVGWRAILRIVDQRRRRAGATPPMSRAI